MAQELVDALGGYIRKYDRKFIKEMLNGLDFVKDLDENGGVIRNLRSPLDLMKMTVDDGVRPLNTDIEQAKGGRTWAKRQLVPRHGMKLFKIIVEEARKSFQSEMMGPNAKREPFAAWKWAVEFEKVAQELNDNFYLNKYHDDPEDFDAGTVYAPGTLIYFDKADGRGKIVYEQVDAGNTVAGESPTSAAAKWQDVDNKVLFDGPGTIIANELLAANLSAFAGGSYDLTTAYEAFKDQFDGIPEARKKKGLKAFCSVDAAQDLASDINSTFGSGKGNGQGGDIEVAAGRGFFMRDTANRLFVHPVTWMGTSRRIIMTRPGNIVVGMDQLSDTQKVGKIIETHHGYEANMKFMLTSEIRDLEDLHVNNEA